jgi:dynein heavy chain
LGLKDLQAAKKIIEDFDNALEENPANIEELKALLNKIAEIKTMSMMMEFRISDIVEKFRTLQMYKQAVDPALVDEAFNLESSWNKLVIKAKEKDHKLLSRKQMFAK